jgi:hypothetical protein
MRGGRRALATIGTAGAALFGAAIALAITGPVTKIDGPEDQLHPSAHGNLVIWTQNSEARPNRDHAYWKVLGTDERTRIDAPHHRGAAGAIEPPDGLRAIYQQMTATDSNLFWYRFEDGHRSPVRIDGVNTDRWERDPRVSASYVFFARDAGTLTKLYLAERPGGPVKRIAAYDFTRFYVAPGAVGDRYATWTTCGPFTCTAWSYDTEAKDPQPRKIPSDGRPQYAPVIDEAGHFVYTARSGQRCGENVGIWRRPWPISNPAPPAERLVLLRDGMDVGFTLSVDRSSGTRVDLWFSRYRCRRQHGDVAVLRNVETLP